jgi:hypothetical protein
MRYPKTPHIVMGHLNPTTVEKYIKNAFSDGVKSDGFHMMDTISDLNDLDFGL